jgi:hypothetical protein
MTDSSAVSSSPPDCGRFSGAFSRQRMTNATSAGGRSGVRTGSRRHEGPNPRIGSLVGVQHFALHSRRMTYD